MLEIERWVIMKRFFLITVAAFALLTPTLASASDGPRLVYRPELRAFVPVVQTQAKPTAPASTLTPAQTIGRHEAMAAGIRANTRGTSTAHCDRLVAEARAAAVKRF